MSRTALLLALLLAACSSDQGEDVPPLPKPTAEGANQLMAEAERAAGNASSRMERTAPPARSTPSPTNEVTQ